MRNAALSPGGVRMLGLTVSKSSPFKSQDIVAAKRNARKERHDVQLYPHQSH